MAPLTVQDALTKLRNASRDIQRRNDVKSTEARRIREAFSLLQNGPPDPSAVGAKRQTKYLQFLQRVQQVNEANRGPMVVLSAVALGVSAIAIMKDSVQLNLPFAMKEIAAQLLHPCLYRLANKHFGISNDTLSSSPGPSPPVEQLLTAQDSRQIQYRCSAAPITQMHHLGDLLFDAVKTSRQWKWERNVGGDGIKATTDCLNVLVPEDRNQDISITLRVGHEKGLELIEKFQLASM